MPAFACLVALLVFDLTGGRRCMAGFHLIGLERSKTYQVVLDLIG